MFPHGAENPVGWFGGFGFSGTMGFFPQQTQILAPLVFLVFVTEFFGSRVLIFHLLSRVAACGVVGTMMGVMVMVHWPNGLFLNWSGSKPARASNITCLAWRCASFSW